MSAYRWIMYVQQHIPGNLSFGLYRCASLTDAREMFDGYCRSVGSDDCSATLYAYTDEGFESAREFEGIGCPFDYPDKVIERGPKGGVKVVKT